MGRYGNAGDSCHSFKPNSSGTSPEASGVVENQPNPNIPTATHSSQSEPPPIKTKITIARAECPGYSESSKAPGFLAKRSDSPPVSSTPPRLTNPMILKRGSADHFRIAEVSGKYYQMDKHNAAAYAADKLGSRQEPERCSAYGLRHGRLQSGLC